MQTSTETQDPVETSTQIRDVLERAGGAAQLLEQCERLVAARPELELLSARLRLFGPHDE